MLDTKETSLKLVLGKDILDRPLLDGADSTNLKHTTYDLTIGDIFPVGREGYNERKNGQVSRYAIGPREAVWILSKEEFRLPPNVTGVATLRTSFTKQGLVAFNVGIIDPHYSGPISTVLLNFSKRSVDLAVGEKFFRVLFLEHANVEPTTEAGESVDRSTYVKELTDKALNDYSKNFLDIPEFDAGFYAQAVKSLIWGFRAKHPYWSAALAIFFFAPLFYIWTLPEYREWFDFAKQIAWSVVDWLKGIAENSQNVEQS